MKTKTVRPAAILLCFLMLFTYLCPYVYAVDEDPVTEFSAEWYERYGVDNDLMPYDDKVDEYWIRDALGYTGDNAMTIFYFLIYDMSLHTSAAVGILTNIYCESSFNYNAVGDNGTSYGICQWHAGRWEKLKAYCNNNGLDWQSLGGQLAYLKYETEVDYPNTMAAIRDTGNDADGAWRSAYLWCKNFEVPANTIATSEKRGDLARDTFWPLYKDLGGGNGDPDQPADPTPTPEPEEPVEIIDIPDEIQPGPDEDNDTEPAEGSTVLDTDIPEDGIIPSGLWFAGIEDKYYTGALIKQDFRVYYSTRRLTEKTDYTVNYVKNKNSGTATLTVRLKGNYSGSRSVSYNILPLDIADSDAADLIVNYNGKVQKPRPKCSLNGKNLSYGRDFTLPDYERDDLANGFKGSISGNMSVSINLCGCGNYCGTKTIYLTFVGKQTEGEASIPQIMLNKVSASSIPAQTYRDDGFSVSSLSVNNLTNSKGAPVTITLKYRGKSLSDNDVEIAGLENADLPGKAYIVLRGRNASESATGYSFVGEKKLCFTIKGKPIGKLKIGGIEKSYAYTGEEICPVPVLSGIDGFSESDYSISYENNIMPGKATLILKGEGVYTGTKKVSFRITAIPLSDEEIFIGDVSGNSLLTDDPHEFEYEYGGVFLEPVITYKGEILEINTDYSLTFRNNQKTGNASVVIKGKGRFNGSCTIKYKILAKDFSDNVRIFVTDGPVNGTSKQPIWVTDLSGNKLKEGTDYSTPKYYFVKNDKLYNVRKKDVLKAGDVIYVMIKGMGGYSKEKVFTRYTLTAGNVSISRLKLVIKDQPYTGNAIKITSEDQIVSATIGDTELTLGKDFRIVSGSYVNNIKKGTAKVTICGCGDYSGQKTVTFRIIAADGQ